MCVCARARAPSRYWARTDMYRYTIENVRIAIEMVRIAVGMGRNIVEMALRSVEFALMRQDRCSAKAAAVCGIAAKVTEANGCNATHQCAKAEEAQ